MRFDIDRFREIADTLRRNKSRTILTGFGVFWGIFMLLALLGSSNGVQGLLGMNFEGFASNSTFVMGQTTSKPYKGFKRGRSIQFKLKDLDVIRNQVPEADIITPLVGVWGKSVVYDTYSFSSASINGVYPEYAKIETPEMTYGRFINDIDVAEGNKVCVIGKKICNTLFPRGGDPCGKFVKIGSVYYEVIGVNGAAGDIHVNGGVDNSVTIPITLVQKVYNRGNDIDLICMTAKPGIRVSVLMNKVIDVMRREHYVSPEDKQAIMGMNVESLFTIMNNIFTGVDILFLLVGIGTLLAGAIGVSNIMMVTVKERTTEIGIRRAIGATPKMILSQIISESITLTMLAGMLGMVFTVVLLGMVELAMTKNGVLMAHFQVGFWQAVLTLIGLTVLGVIAGLAPASRAMAIKPVDAMREE